MSIRGRRAAKRLRLARFVLLALSLAVVPGFAHADEEALAGRPKLQVFRVAEPPVLDGRLDDAAWQGAAKVSQFTQQNPREGAPATELTEVWVGYDSQHLYLAIYAHYSDVTQMRANRVDRDQTRRDDRVSIYLDTFLDQQRAYRFSVNGYGVQGDAIMNVGGGGGRGGPGGGGGDFRGEDDSWDALFRTAGGPVADGWVVEVAIPFKSLRYPSRKDGDTHRWGFQILRNIEGKDEDLAWSPISRSNPGFLTQMGVLHGMSNLSTSRNLEILPTLTTVQFGSLDSDTGAYDNHDVDPDFGVNLKYGLTTNLTADFTYNPDFSQIESDRPQIEVNQRFPVFYSEQRPFFLEGQEIFDTSINLVHTRTIVDPQFGAKLTGKVGSTNIGILVADDEAPGRLDDVGDPLYGANSHNLIARVRRDLYAESFIGAIVTDREFGPSYSRAVGVDGRFRLANVYRLSFMAAATDLEDLEGDARSGTAFQANFNRSGRSLSYSINHSSYSPDFETQSGFIRRTDQRDTQVNTSYTFWPESWVLSWGPRAQYSRNYDFDGILQDEEFEVGLNGRFARSIGFRANATRQMERYADIDFNKWRYSFGGDANFSRTFSFGGNWHWGDGIRYEDDPFLGRTRGGFLSVTARPMSRLEANLTVNFSRFVDPRTDTEVFDVKIYRTRFTYQITRRLQLRNISEYDSYDGKFGINLLGTYRINSGTVFFIGYDDRYRRRYNLNPDLWDTRAFERTGRSFFMKFAYLFRY